MSVSRNTVKYCCLFCDNIFDQSDQRNRHLQLEHPEKYKLEQDFLNSRTSEEKDKAVAAAAAELKAEEYLALSGKFMSYYVL